MQVKPQQRASEGKSGIVFSIATIYYNLLQGLNVASAWNQKPHAVPAVWTKPHYLCLIINRSFKWNKRRKNLSRQLMITHQSVGFPVAPSASLHCWIQVIVRWFKKLSRSVVRDHCCTFLHSLKVSQLQICIHIHIYCMYCMYVCICVKRRNRPFLVGCLVLGFIVQHWLRKQTTVIIN